MPKTSNIITINKSGVKAKTTAATTPGPAAKKAAAVGSGKASGVPKSTSTTSGVASPRSVLGGVNKSGIKKIAKGVGLITPKSTGKSTGPTVQSSSKTITATGQSSGPAAANTYSVAKRAPRLLSAAKGGAEVTTAAGSTTTGTTEPKFGATTTGAATTTALKSETTSDTGVVLSPSHHLKNPDSGQIKQRGEQGLENIFERDYVPQEPHVAVQIGYHTSETIAGEHGHGIGGHHVDAHGNRIDGHGNLILDAHGNPISAIHPASEISHRGHDEMSSTGFHVTGQDEYRGSLDGVLHTKPGLVSLAIGGEMGHGHYGKIGVFGGDNGGDNVVQADAPIDYYSNMMNDMNDNNYNTADHNMKSYQSVGPKSQEETPGYHGEGDVRETVVPAGGLDKDETLLDLNPMDRQVLSQGQRIEEDQVKSLQSQESTTTTRSSILGSLQALPGLVKDTVVAKVQSNKFMSKYVSHIVHKKDHKEKKPPKTNKLNFASFNSHAIGSPLASSSLLGNSEDAEGGEPDTPRIHGERSTSLQVGGQAGAGGARVIDTHATETVEEKRRGFKGAQQFFPPATDGDPASVGQLPTSTSLHQATTPSNTTGGPEEAPEGTVASLLRGIPDNPAYAKVLEDVALFKMGGRAKDATVGLKVDAPLKGIGKMVMKAAVSKDTGFSQAASDTTGIADNRSSIIGETTSGITGISDNVSDITPFPHFNTISTNPAEVINKTIDNTTDDVNAIMPQALLPQHRTGQDDKDSKQETTRLTKKASNASIKSAASKTSQSKPITSLTPKEKARSRPPSSKPPSSVGPVTAKSAQSAFPLRINAKKATGLAMSGTDDDRRPTSSRSGSGMPSARNNATAKRELGSVRKEPPGTAVNAFPLEINAKKATGAAMSTDDSNVGNKSTVKKDNLSYSDTSTSEAQQAKAPPTKKVLSKTSSIKKDSVISSIKLNPSMVRTTSQSLGQRTSSAERAPRRRSTDSTSSPVVTPRQVIHPITSSEEPSPRSPRDRSMRKASVKSNTSARSSKIPEDKPKMPKKLKIASIEKSKSKDKPDTDADLKGSPGELPKERMVLSGVESPEPETPRRKPGKLSAATSFLDKKTGNAKRVRTVGKIMTHEDIVNGQEDVKKKKSTNRAATPQTLMEASLSSELSVGMGRVVRPSTGSVDKDIAPRGSAVDDELRAAYALDQKLSSEKPKKVLNSSLSGTSSDSLGGSKNKDSVGKALSFASSSRESSLPGSSRASRTKAPSTPERANEKASGTPPRGRAQRAFENKPKTNGVHVPVIDALGSSRIKPMGQQAKAEASSSQIESSGDSSARPQDLFARPTAVAAKKLTPTRILADADLRGVFNDKYGDSSDDHKRYPGYDPSGHHGDKKRKSMTFPEWAETLNDGDISLAALRKFLEFKRDFEGKKFYAQLLENDFLRMFQEEDDAGRDRMMREIKTAHDPESLSFVDFIERVSREISSTSGAGVHKRQNKNLFDKYVDYKKEVEGKEYLGGFPAAIRGLFDNFDHTLESVAQKIDNNSREKVAQATERDVDAAHGAHAKIRVSKSEEHVKATTKMSETLDSRGGRTTSNPLQDLLVDEGQDRLNGSQSARLTQGEKFKTALGANDVITMDGDAIVREYIEDDVTDDLMRSRSSRRTYLTHNVGFQKGLPGTDVEVLAQRKAGEDDDPERKSFIENIKDGVSEVAMNVMKGVQQSLDESAKDRHPSQHSETDAFDADRHVVPFIKFDAITSGSSSSKLPGSDFQRTGPIKEKDEFADIRALRSQLSSLRDNEFSQENRVVSETWKILSPRGRHNIGSHTSSVYSGSEYAEGKGSYMFGMDGEPQSAQGGPSRGLSAKDHSHEIVSMKSRNDEDDLNLKQELEHLRGMKRDFDDKKVFEELNHEQVKHHEKMLGLVEEKKKLEREKEKEKTLTSKRNNREGELGNQAHAMERNRKEMELNKLKMNKLVGEMEASLNKGEKKGDQKEGQVSDPPAQQALEKTVSETVVDHDMNVTSTEAPQPVPTVDPTVVDPVLGILAADPTVADPVLHDAFKRTQTEIDATEIAHLGQQQKPKYEKAWHGMSDEAIFEYELDAESVDVLAKLEADEEQARQELETILLLDSDIQDGGNSLNKSMNAGNTLSSDRDSRKSWDMEDGVVIDNYQSRAAFDEAEEKARLAVEEAERARRQAEEGARLMQEQLTTEREAREKEREARLAAEEAAAQAEKVAAQLNQSSAKGEEKSARRAQQELDMPNKEDAKLESRREDEATRGKEKLYLEEDEAIKRLDEEITRLENQLNSQEPESPRREFETDAVVSRLLSQPVGPESRLSQEEELTFNGFVKSLGTSLLEFIVLLLGFTFFFILSSSLSIGVYRVMMEPKKTDSDGYYTYTSYGVETGASDGFEISPRGFQYMEKDLDFYTNLFPRKSVITDVLRHLVVIPILHIFTLNTAWSLLRLENMFVWLGKQYADFTTVKKASPVSKWTTTEPVPPMPTMEIPNVTVPTLELPSMPTLELPTMATVSLPEVPTIRLPEMPSWSGPAGSTFHWFRAPSTSHSSSSTPSYWDATSYTPPYGAPASPSSLSLFSEPEPKGLFKGIADAFSDATQAIGTGVQSAAVGTASGIAGLVDGLGSGFGSAAFGVRNAAQKIGLGLGSAASGIGKGFGSAAKFVGEGIGSAAAGLGSGVDSVGKGLGSLANGISRDFKDTAGSTSEGLSILTETGLHRPQGLSSGLLDMGDAIGSGPGAGVLNLTSSLGSSVLDVSSFLGSGALDTGASVADAVFTAVDLTKDGFGILGIILMAIGQFMLTALGSLTAFTFGALEWLTDAVVNLGVAIADVLTATLGSGFQLVGKSFELMISFFDAVMYWPGCAVTGSLKMLSLGISQYLHFAFQAWSGLINTTVAMTKMTTSSVHFIATDLVMKQGVSGIIGGFSKFILSVVVDGFGYAGHMFGATTLFVMDGVLLVVRGSNYIPTAFNFVTRELLPMISNTLGTVLWRTIIVTAKGFTPVVYVAGVSWQGFANMASAFAGVVIPPFPELGTVTMSVWGGALSLVGATFRSLGAYSHFMFMEIGHDRVFKGFLMDFFCNVSGFAYHTLSTGCIFGSHVLGTLIVIGMDGFLFVLKGGYVPALIFPMQKFGVGTLRFAMFVVETTIAGSEVVVDGIASGVATIVSIPGQILYHVLPSFVTVSEIQQVISYPPYAVITLWAGVMTVSKGAIDCTAYFVNSSAEALTAISMPVVSVANVYVLDPLAIVVGGSLVVLHYMFMTLPYVLSQGIAVGVVAISGGLLSAIFGVTESVANLQLKEPVYGWEEVGANSMWKPDMGSISGIAGAVSSMIPDMSLPSVLNEGLGNFYASDPAVMNDLAGKLSPKTIVSNLNHGTTMGTSDGGMFGSYNMGGSDGSYFDRGFHAFRCCFDNWMLRHRRWTSPEDTDAMISQTYFPVNILAKWYKSILLWVGLWYVGR